MHCESRGVPVYDFLWLCMYPSDQQFNDKLLWWEHTTSERNKTTVSFSSTWRGMRWKQNELNKDMLTRKVSAQHAPNVSDIRGLEPKTPSAVTWLSIGCGWWVSVVTRPLIGARCWEVAEDQIHVQDNSDRDGSGDTVVPATWRECIQQANTVFQRLFHTEWSAAAVFTDRPSMLLLLIL